MRVIWVMCLTMMVLAGCGPLSSDDDGSDLQANGGKMAPMTNQGKVELAKLDDAVLHKKPPFDRLPSPPIVKNCIDDPKHLCDSNRLRFLTDWSKAWSGEYIAQRNIAFLLSRPQPGVLPDTIQGCAWRIVIAATGSADNRAGDRSNYHAECSKLSSTDFAAAKAMAPKIFEKSSGGKLPSIPAP